MSISSISKVTVKGTPTIFSANSFALLSSFIKAPIPNLISSTSTSNCSAAFLEMIEPCQREEIGMYFIVFFCKVFLYIFLTGSKKQPAISPKWSIVPVTSRTAYILLSAGTKFAVWPTMQQPTSFKQRIMSVVDADTDRPGIASNLSRVPPVWASPRPDIIGTYSGKKIYSFF